MKVTILAIRKSLDKKDLINCGGSGSLQKHSKKPAVLRTGNTGNKKAILMGWTTLLANTSNYYNNQVYALRHRRRDLI